MLVGDKMYTLNNIKNFEETDVFSVASMVKYCGNKECEFYSLCYGGCPFKNLMLNDKLDNICKYEFIKNMNSLIFIVQITDLRDNNEIRRFIKDVEYFKIDF